MISLIVAVAKNGVIGSKGQLPWHLPGDLKNFKNVTMGKPIIMGRKTFESIGKPLPGRKNVVISRNPNLHIAGVEVFSNLELALQALNSEAEVFVIGGADLFKASLNKAHKIYLTDIDREFDGDVFMPPLPQEFKVTETRKETENDISYTIKTLIRQ